jgi:hypothetical protein
VETLSVGAAWVASQHPLVLLVPRPRDRVHPHPRHVGVTSADMAQCVYPNVPLNVVSVTFTKDCLATGYEGLPLRYSVMLGLSRPISGTR